MTSPIPPSKEAVEAATASILIWLDCNEMLGIDDDIHAVLAALSSAESENTRLSRVFSQNLDLQMEVADLRSRLEIAERDGAIARAVVADAEYALACEGGSFGYDAMQRLRRSVREFNRDVESPASQEDKTITAPQPCTTCHGKGFAGGNPYPCQACHGTGFGRRPSPQTGDTNG